MANDLTSFGDESDRNLDLHLGRGDDRRRAIVRNEHFDGAYVSHEPFVNLPEPGARAHSLHLLLVLEIGATALEDEVGRALSLVQPETRVREHARLQVRSPEL